MLEFEPNSPIQVEDADFFWGEFRPEEYSDISSDDNAEMEAENPDLDLDTAQNSQSVQSLYNQGYQVLEGLYGQGYQVGFAEGHNHAISQGFQHGYNLGYQAGLAAQQMRYHQQHLHAQNQAAERLAQRQAEEARLREIRAQEAAVFEMEQARAQETQQQEQMGQINSSMILTEDEKQILADIFDWN